MTTIREDDKYQSSSGIVNRLGEIVELLGKYCPWGIYGEYLNSDEPSLTDDTRSIVLELEGLQNKPDLLVAVVFSFIIYIEDKMYRMPRSLKRCCIIGEGRKLFSFKSEKAGQLIKAGYRTICHRRGVFITISQNIEGFDVGDASGTTEAVWGSSTFKVILKRDASESKRYNQNHPNQFSELERSVAGKLGGVKDQWFPSFVLRINDTCSFHCLFVDPLSRMMFSSKGDDFGFVHQCRGQNMGIHDAVYQLTQRNLPDEMRELEAPTEVA